MAWTTDTFLHGTFTVQLVNANGRILPQPTPLTDMRVALHTSDPDAPDAGTVSGEGYAYRMINSRPFTFGNDRGIVAQTLDSIRWHEDHGHVPLVPHFNDPLTFRLDGHMHAGGRTAITGFWTISDDIAPQTPERTGEHRAQYGPQPPTPRAIEWQRYVAQSLDGEPLTGGVKILASDHAPVTLPPPPCGRWEQDDADEGSATVFFPATAYFWSTNIPEATDAVMQVADDLAAMQPTLAAAGRAFAEGLGEGLQAVADSWRETALTAMLNETWTAILDRLNAGAAALVEFAEEAAPPPSPPVRNQTRLAIDASAARAHTRRAHQGRRAYRDLARRRF